MLGVEPQPKNFYSSTGPWPLATKKISSSVGRAEKAAHMWAVP